MRLAYLDIALPHRGSENILSIIHNSAKSTISAGSIIPKFSITSNTPSVMNGGKDFCSWSKQDEKIAGHSERLSLPFLENTANI